MEPISIISINKDACVNVYAVPESGMLAAVIYDDDHMVHKIVDIDPLDITASELCAAAIVEFATFPASDDYAELYDSIDLAVADLRKASGREIISFSDGVLSVDIQRVINTRFKS